MFDEEIDYENEYEYECDGKRSYKISCGINIYDDSNQNFIDKESIVLAAVQNYGYALEFASERLKANKFIVSEAVKQSGGALKFASVNLKRDEAVVLQAIKTDTDAIYYLPSALSNIFIDFKYKSVAERMNYLFEKIHDGTLLPYAVIWLQLIPSYCHIQLVDWIKSNIYVYKNLFEVSFYKHSDFVDMKRLGYLEGVPRLMRSFLVSSRGIQLKQEKIIRDIFNELQVSVSVSV